jgi:hypothetical protein
MSAIIFAGDSLPAINATKASSVRRTSVFSDGANFSLSRRSSTMVFLSRCILGLYLPLKARASLTEDSIP